MITQYVNNIYPADLWVGFYSDFEKAKKMFKFFYTVEELQRNEEPTDIFPKIAAGTSGVTYLIRLKKDSTKGLLILLNEDAPLDQYEFILDLVSHEASHAVDAIYQIIRETPGDYDSGNEPHAYLTGWVAGCVGHTLTKYFKEKDGRKEV